MKKLVILIIVLLMLVGLGTGCTVDITGLDHFSEADCSFELSRDLFPDDQFLSAFDYIDGNYELNCNDKLGSARATAFAFLTYSPEIYEEAKQYCLDNFDFCDEHRYTYADFEFNEHLSHFVRNDENELVVGCCYPKWFNMFSFCDEKCTLIFLGYYNADTRDSELELAQSDFGAFIESVYSKYYHFE